MPVTLSDDDGYFDLTVTREGQECKARLDLFRSSYALAKLHADHDDGKGPGFWPAVQAWAAEQGFPDRLSQGTLEAITTCVFGLVADIRKKLAGALASPGSAASTASRSAG